MENSTSLPPLQEINSLSRTRSSENSSSRRTNSSSPFMSSHHENSLQDDRTKKEPLTNSQRSCSSLFGLNDIEHSFAQSMEISSDSECRPDVCEREKKKLKTGLCQSFANIRELLQQKIIQTCTLKVERLNVMKEMIANQDRPEKIQELKPKHQELLTQEQRLCSEINYLKTQSSPSPAISPQSTPKSISPINTITPNSNNQNSTPQLPPLSSMLPQVLSTVPTLWSGNLVFALKSSDVCPEYKSFVQRAIEVTLYPADPTDPKVMSLMPQNEIRANPIKPSTWPHNLKITGVSQGSNLQVFKKYVLRLFTLSALANQPADNFQYLRTTLVKYTWIGVIDLPENTIVLTPHLDKLLVIVLVKMTITGHKVEALTSSVSSKYYRDGEVSFDEKIIDGFYDPGRGQQFLSLEEYLKPSSMSDREVILVNAREDSRLAVLVQRAEEMLNRFADVESQARMLALFVSNCFGGERPSVNTSYEHIKQLKAVHKSNVIRIGEITFGVCRHRSIVYKYMCDRFNIPCSLKRGTYTNTAASDKVTGAHAWNVVKLGVQYFVVDVMHEPTQLYPMDSEKAKHYTSEASSVNVSSKNETPNYRTELSSRRFVRLPNLREKPVFHERLGRGNSSVHRITLGGLSCALKRIDLGKMTEEQRQYSLQEVHVMEMLHHSNIVHYLGHELLEDKNELHILMELFPFSLGQLIERRRKTGQRFAVSEIKSLAIEILNGIDYLHNQKICHRDLKPDNILVDLDENDQVNKLKITDFGVCKIIQNDNHSTQTCVGTELYMAPEQNDNRYPASFKIDIWSFGIILVELLTMNPPYSTLNRTEAINQMKAGIPPPLPDSRQLSLDEQRVVCIIQKCLQVDPSKRPAAEDALISFFRLQCTVNNN